MLAQTATELEYQRQRLIKEIEVTSSQLAQAKQNKASTLEQYIVAKKRVEKRQALIFTLEQEINYINKSIFSTELVINALEEDIERLHQEYAAMLRHAYRQKLNDSRWLFFFSAQSFNDAAQRWRYLKQYDQYRKKQERLIYQTKRTLENKVTQLQQNRLEKEKLIEENKQQQALLNQELKDKNILLSKLKSHETKLAQSLATAEKKREALDAAIERIILAETKRRTSETATVTIEEGSGFRAMLGKLPLPLDGGTITKTFGIHHHPSYPNVETFNNGIDIQANGNNTVRAVFNGKVLSKQFISSYQNTIILSHGNYYTVYSNLETVSVNKGEFVTAGQVIGVVSSQKSELHFEIWREKQRLNPSDWVKL
jgi:septal ring factor EnvC (AmiA/AmiB activator)